MTFPLKEQFDYIKKIEDSQGSLYQYDDEEGIPSVYLNKNFGWDLFKEAMKNLKDFYGFVVTQDYEFKRQIEIAIPVEREDHFHYFCYIINATFIKNVKTIGYINWGPLSMVSINIRANFISKSGLIKNYNSKAFN